MSVGIRAILIATMTLALVGYLLADELRIAETIPVGVDLETALTTYDAWKEVVDRAQRTLHIGCMYFTLRGGSELYPTNYGGWMGEDIYRRIEAAAQRGVDVRIVLQAPAGQFNDSDAFALQAAGLASVAVVDFAQLSPGDNGGVLHTKFLIADSSIIYCGSANLDWRALAQVKELGALVTSPAYGADFEAIFEAYWLAAKANATLHPFPPVTAAKYSLSIPLEIDLERGSQATLFSAVSPPTFAAPDVQGRTGDLEALVHIIGCAKERLDIEVMDYFPSSIYAHPSTANYYWPPIDDAIRAAAFRGVQVRFLAGIWNHTRPEMWQYLYSLNDLTHVDVRQMVLPDMPIPVPFTRVNHAKYCATEDSAYIGTSNWTADYYTDTAGISINVNSTAVADDVRLRFERDWHSKYSHSLSS